MLFTKHDRIKYGALRKLLTGFGYTDHITEGKYIVFRHPKSDLPIYLPRMRATQYVPPVEILSIRNVLENAGFWDSLVRQTGTNGPDEAIHVLQTLAGIKATR